MPWWEGAEVRRDGGCLVVVETLAQALNEAVELPARRTSAPLRMPITGTFKIKGVGDVVTGRITQGGLKLGEEVTIAPSMGSRATPAVVKVHSCEMHYEQLDEPKAGDIVGLNLKGLDKANMPRVGEVLTVPRHLPPAV